ncbi:MAG: hypothetical protein ACO3ZW_09655, partial [Opitutales bacterium]
GNLDAKKVLSKTETLNIKKDFFLGYFPILWIAVANLISALEKALIKHRRKTLSRELFARHGGKVKYGAFKGLRFRGNPNISWSSAKFLMSSVFLARSRL